MADRVGQVLRRAGRSSDALGRLDGGEVAVIAPATSAQGAVHLVNRLAGEIEALPAGSGDVAPTS